MDHILNDPTTDPSTKNKIAQLYDSDSDGTVTSQEVADTYVVKLVLAGDVDLDGDNVKEISFGVGFEVTKAWIN